ncbi:TIGR02449 family protein [Cardiobacterium sp. AH-315-I02]|nr:TIGR02449 family protein [Cardiobacterium sp. AH-315-I02]
MTFHALLLGMTDTLTRITKLENQVGELLELCQRLGSDNNELRDQLKRLSSERSGLMEKKEKVRVQVESMITRLRSMEKA